MQRRSCGTRAQAWAAQHWQWCYRAPTSRSPSQWRGWPSSGVGPEGRRVRAPGAVRRASLGERLVDRRASHVAPVLSVVKRGRPMHGAAIVPDHEITDRLPVQLIAELRLGRELDELAQELASFLHRPPDDMRCVRCEVECLALGSRMDL